MPSCSLDILTRLDPAVPAALAARADAWSATSAPVVARPSASVILCREVDAGSAGGLEVYLLHRHARMRFAASMAVFPGGGLDPVDQLAGDPRAGCAIRETLEETGVALRVDDLVPWAHWITPEFEPIRYDTTFYLAALPVGQTAEDISGETAGAGWTRPGQAIDAYRAGSLQLLPPTFSILLELAELPSMAAAAELGRDRIVETVLPQVVRATEGWVFRYPRRSGAIADRAPRR